MPSFISISLSLWVITLIFPEKKDGFTQCLDKRNLRRTFLDQEEICPRQQMDLLFAIRWRETSLKFGSSRIPTWAQRNFPRTVSSYQSPLTNIKYKAQFAGMTLFSEYFVSQHYLHHCSGADLSKSHIPCLSLQLIDHKCNPSQATSPYMQWSGLLAQSFWNTN